MKQTTNYKLNKPDGTDSVDITKINANMDILDTEVKKVDTKIDNITVPVTSVNSKTGAVVLSSRDIKMEDGTTLESAINNKSSTFNKSDKVDLNDSNTIATSKAICALNKLKQDKTLINPTLATDKIELYPDGISTFYVYDDSWNLSLGTDEGLYIVTTTNDSTQKRAIQEVSCFEEISRKIIGIYQRYERLGNGWGEWIQVYPAKTDRVNLGKYMLKSCLTDNRIFTYYIPEKYVGKIEELEVTFCGSHDRSDTSTYYIDVALSDGSIGSSTVNVFLKIPKINSNLSKGIISLEPIVRGTTTMFAVERYDHSSSTGCHFTSSIGDIKQIDFGSSNVPSELFIDGSYIKLVATLK